MGIGAAMTLSLVGSLDWVDLAPPAILLAAAFLTVGWLLDLLTYLRSNDPGSPTHQATLASSLLPTIGISAILVGAVLIVKAVLPIAAINDLFLAVICVMPLASLAWIAFQHRQWGPWRALHAAAGRLIRHTSNAAPARSDATIIAVAGYISVLISVLAAEGGLGDVVSHWGIPLSYEILALPVLIIVVSQLGINPLVAAVVLGSILAPFMPEQVIPRIALALAIQGGWVLALCTAPYSGSALMLARSIDQSPWTVTGWNRTYAAICLVILTAFNALLLMR
jgi:hypothetical protein